MTTGSLTVLFEDPFWITDFANKHQATLTVMEGGEHWFHTEEQMQFLDNLISD